MRFEDQSPSGDQPAPGAAPPPPPVPADVEGRRRRSPRSWSSPAPAAPRVDRPATDRDWSQGRRFGEPPTSERPEPPRPAPPRTAPLGSAPAGALPVDLGPVLSQLRDLRGELGELRAALVTGAAERDSTLVTGPELASTIEALGATLGSGMATLLTEHRNLLARDIDAAADRILEELAQRLRTSGAQTVDALEERIRQVTGKAMGDLAEQLDLRLDQLQTDVTGLRAVMLELPDQTAVLERLDQVLEGLGSTRSLTSELSALRRRISVRGERGDAVELSADQLDALADRIAERLGGSSPSATPRTRPSRTSRSVARPAAEDDGEDEILLAAPAEEAADEDEAAESAPAPAKRAPTKRAARKRA